MRVYRQCMSGTDSDLDLTGVWHGQFTYPGGLPPNAFVATLMETGGRIGGGVHETGDQGPALGKPLLSSVAGTRTGASVSFVKIYVVTAAYVVSSGYVSPVRYEGALSPDGDEIEGTWTIPGAWSGRFLMIRSRAPDGAREERADEPVLMDQGR